MKSALIAIIGRPSTGKSTLLNKICGHKVSIVSSVPQTTRNQIKGIYTEIRGQIVFLDTPGFHFSEKKFNNQMKSVVFNSLEDVDLVLYLCDSSRKPGKEEQTVAELLKKYESKLLLVFNKIDLKNNFKEEYHSFFKDLITAKEIIEISATEETNMDMLKVKLFEHSPEGEMLYPEEFYTDQEPEFRISELIREKVITKTRQELPHAVFVEIIDLERDEEKKRLWIRAVINVERESQKGMVVGKGGKLIKEIRVESQKDIAQLFPYRIELDLRVKVNYKWRRKDNLIKKIVY